MILRFSKANATALVVLAASGILVSHCSAQTAEEFAARNMFPFVMPWDDATPGTVTDVSYLNAKPAGVNGRIIVKDGKFVESRTGNRVRFLGMNFSFETNFPTHSDATKIAAHLAKLGFNIVRIHHHDHNSTSLWDKNAPGRQKFNPETLDRLDFLIAELKKQGIYTNLNLHVSRSFTPEDGFPQSVTKLPERFNKRVDRFNARMIELQKNFARDYLTRVNPYTKMSYTEDPCIAVVEINNENSLVGWGKIDSYFDRLPEPFQSEITGKWNDWLAKRYPTDEALRTAWAAGVQPAANTTPALPGSDPRTAETAWLFENRVPGATLSKMEVAGQNFPDLVITNAQAGTNYWDLQPQLRPLNFEDGKLYSVAFRAKADKPRIIRVQSSIFGGDWHNTGLLSPVRLSTEWQEFRFAFRANKPEPNLNRVSFTLANDTGTVWLSNVRVEPGQATDLVPVHYSVKQKNIDLPAGNNTVQTGDWLRFLTETERQYSDEMRRFLRQDLRVKASLVDSQMSFGASSSFNREADSDFIDEHAYWEHPTFSGTDWDPANWNINQVSMVKVWAENNLTALHPMAFNRVAGKPFALSEYCVPAPNDYQAEMFPIMASFAALQDWDAIYHFDYGDYGDNKKLDRIQGFFAFGGNPVKESYATAAALIFRAGKIAPLTGVTTLHMDSDAPFRAKPIREVWRNANGNKYPSLLDTRLQAVVDSKVTQPQLSNISAAPGSSTARAIHTPAGAQYIAEGQGAVAIAGFVGGQTVQTKAAQFTFPTFGNNYAAFILTAADNAALADSRRLLLTIGGKAENLKMGWNDKRTSVGNNWGQGPAHTEGIPATITMTNNQVKRVWALDPTGKRVQEVPATVTNGKLTFTIGPSYRTMHYEVAL